MAKSDRRRLRGDGTVTFDEKRNRWIGRAWINDDTRRQVSAKTQKEAAAKLRKLIETPDTPKAQAFTVAQALTEWHAKSLLARTTNASPSTLSNHEWAIALLTGDAIAKKRVDEIDAAAVEKALARIAKKHDYARSSLVKIRSTLNQTMTWHMKRRSILHNPVVGVEIPTCSKPNQERRALNADELKALIAALGDSPRQAMYVVMATLGLRPGEAAALCRDAVDLGSSTVTVQRGIRLDHGRPFLTSELKTRKSFRTITMPLRTRDALAQHIAEGDFRPSDLLFPGDNDGPIYASTMRKELARASEEAGLEKVRPVELRHSAATMMVEHMPMHKVADVLGHTTTRMLDQNYRHRPEIIETVDVLA